MGKITAMAAALIIAAVPGGISQEGKIYFGSGENFLISSGNYQESLPVPRGTGDDIDLKRGDVIQTGMSTSLEIQLIPSGILILIGENSSLIYNGFDEPGRFIDLNLLYGRIRVVTWKKEVSPTETAAAAGTKPVAVAIRGGIAAVRLSEGDIGVEYFLAPSMQEGDPPRSLLRVYDFRNGSLVFPYDAFGKPTVSQTITLEEGDCLFMEVISSLVFSERKALDKSLIRLWEADGFQGRAPLGMPDLRLRGTDSFFDSSPPTEAIEVETEGPPVPSPHEIFEKDLFFRQLEVKNTWLGLGVAFTALGLGGRVASEYMAGGTSLKEPFKVGSYITLGLGGLCFLVGLIYNPGK